MFCQAYDFHKLIPRSHSHRNPVQTMSQITIINLNMGNVGSIPNMLERIGCKSLVTSDVEAVRNAKKLILPGVGSFDAAMTELQKLNLLSVLNQKVLEEKVPILGICLGMQLLSKGSEEGNLPGLSWINGKVVRFHFENDPLKKLKIPHMGWNLVQNDPSIPILQGFDSDPRFYFVHSYHLDNAPLGQQTQVALAHYGYGFPAVIQRDNIYGVQFHPEKSHRFGLKLLENFVQL